MNYQFIVVSINEQRKKFMEEQFTKLSEKYRVIFVEGYTPNNSEEYLVDIEDETDRKRACCLRSHLKALKTASDSSEYDFSIILEDDVVFHKTQFINVIEELISSWEEKICPSKMISLGWVPIKNYSDYLHRPSCGSVKSILGSKIFYTFMAVGLQCYMVRKKDIVGFIDLFIKPRYREIENFYLSFLEENKMNKNAVSGFKVIPADYFINWILEQKSLFPLLVIEQGLRSTINKDVSAITYWDIFFEGYENIKDDYFLE